MMMMLMFRQLQQLLSLLVKVGYSGNNERPTTRNNSYTTHTTRHYSYQVKKGTCITTAFNDTMCNFMNKSSSQYPM